MRMDTGNYDVHFFEHRIREIERAICQDVDLDARQKPDSFNLFRSLPNPAYVLSGANIIQSVGECEVLGVIGDRQVFISVLTGGGGHLFDGALSIGFHGMSVHFTANVPEGHKLWQPMFGSGVYFTAILA